MGTKGTGNLGKGWGDRSISSWAIPIVVVPKITEPGEPPRRRLCVDFWVINGLLPEVQKAHSKAKEI